MTQIKNFNFSVKYKAPKELKTLLKQGTSAGGNEWNRLNLPVTDMKSTVYLECMGSKRAKLKVYCARKDENDKVENFQKEITWAERLNKSLIEELASFAKYTLVIGEEKQVFATEWDFNNAVYNAIVDGQFDNKTLFIRGQILYSEYKGKPQQKFKPSYIQVNDSDKLYMSGEVSFSFTGDAMDIESGRSKNQVYIDGHVLDYNSDIKEKTFYKRTFVMDYSELEKLEGEAKEKAIKKFGFMKKCFQGKSTDKVYEMGFLTSFVMGSEEVELTIDDLTEFEKDSLEYGYTLEDIKKARGTKRGDFRQDTLLLMPLLSVYPNGVIEVETLTPADLVTKKSVELVSADEVIGDVFNEDDLPF